ncbi:hypothetical protein [Streptomyces sp. NBC_00299]|uniref:hypothetical protein n=1 Tax=Streptomyces sp. NBC_00299 TaxID=2975705 RepID=UPI002E2A9EA0|nr:hypothetical protein [Streptomyces sp. NBC_00299]
MDAGIAAVLGAVAGSVSGVIGSIAAGRAQREGVRMTVRAEAFKERHQPRRDAYKEFLQVLLNLDARLNTPAYEDSTAAEEKQLRSDLDARWIDLVLVGPEPITVVGAAVRTSVDDMIAHMGTCRLLLQDALKDYEDEDEGEAARQEYEDAINMTDEFRSGLADCINVFGGVASKILDKDGTEMPRFIRWKAWRSKRAAARRSASEVA